MLCLLIISALPLPPEYVTVLDVTFDSIKLAWNSTSNTTMAHVTSYIIEYRRNGSTDEYVKKLVTEPEILVDGLSPDSSYEFRIHSVNDGGLSMSAATIIFTTRRPGQTSFSFIRQ